MGVWGEIGRLVYQNPRGGEEHIYSYSAIKDLFVNLLVKTLEHISSVQNVRNAWDRRLFCYSGGGEFFFSLVEMPFDLPYRWKRRWYAIVRNFNTFQGFHNGPWILQSINGYHLFFAVLTCMLCYHDFWFGRADLIIRFGSFTST